jgi:hypothetical protein
LFRAFLFSAFFGMPFGMSLSDGFPWIVVDGDGTWGRKLSGFATFLTLFAPAV